MKTWLRPSFSQPSPEATGTCAAPVSGAVDAHVHVFPPEIIGDRQSYLGKDARFDELYASPQARMAMAEEVVAQMDERGTGMSVVFGFAFSDVGLCKVVNDYVMGAVQKYPDRLAGLACVPWDSPDAAPELDRCLDAGLRGCGELAPRSGDSEEIARIGAVAAVLRERGLPLMVHASEPVGHDYPGKGRFTPDACVALAQAYPGLKLVLSHLGGGTFLYEAMPEVRAILADVVYDTAAIPYLYSPSIYEAAAASVGAHKLVFGSDYPLLDPVRCAEGVDRLSVEEQQAVLAGNARRVFGL